MRRIYRHFMLREILSPIRRSMSTFLKTLGKCANVPTISLGKAVNDSFESFRLPRDSSPRNLVSFTLKSYPANLSYGFDIIKVL